MPRSGATMASATLLSSARFIATSSIIAHSAVILPPLYAVGKGRIALSSVTGPEHLNPRQRLALQPFEEGAAGGRDISQPPGRAGCIERRDRVTAARHRYNLPGGGEFRRGFRDLDRADVERFELEGAERPVPDQRLDPGEHGADTLDAARADVQDHLIVTDAVHRDHARGRIRRERFGNHGVDRQYELTALALRLGHDLLRGRQEIVLAQRFSHGMSARGQKGIGHAAADDESVDFCEQAAEQVELGRYLGSADDRRERTDGSLQYVRERLEFILHGAAGIGRQPMSDALDRGMGAVRHREGVVDEDVAERGELRDETGIVALLARVESGVLQAQDVARLHGVHRRRRPFADAILRERDRPLEDGRDHRRERLERLCRVGPFRASEMGEQDHLAALVGNLADGRSHPLDAGRVRDLAVFDRHVEIDTQEYAFAPHVGLIEGAEHISGLRVWSCERKPPQRDARSSPAGQISFPIATAVSTIRLEKPHSLSYHDITHTSVPSITLVWSMANTDECASWLKSLETLGASV